MPWTMSTSTVTGTASIPMHFAHNTFTSIVFFAKMPDKKIKNRQKHIIVAKSSHIWLNLRAPGLSNNSIFMTTCEKKRKIS